MSASTPSDRGHRAALVLGAAVWPGEQPSPALRRRALHAVHLYRRGDVTRIIASGGLGRHPPAEAEVIRRLCMAGGVPASAILIENRSATTRENIANALPIARAAGIRNIILVTDSYHAPRARLTARSLGLPSPSDSPPFSGTGRLRLIRAILREGPALALYFLRYLRGR